MGSGHKGALEHISSDGRHRKHSGKAASLKCHPGNWFYKSWREGRAQSQGELGQETLGATRARGNEAFSPMIVIVVGPLFMWFFMV